MPVPGCVRVLHGPGVEVSRLWGLVGPSVGPSRGCKGTVLEMAPSTAGSRGRVVHLPLPVCLVYSRTRPGNLTALPPRVHPELLLANLNTPEWRQALRRDPPRLLGLLALPTQVPRGEEGLSPQPTQAPTAVAEIHGHGRSERQAGRL